jgi:hypothetical protein
MAAAIRNQSIFYGRPGHARVRGVLGADAVWILVTYLKSLGPAEVPAGRGNSRLGAVLVKSRPARSPLRFAASCVSIQLASVRLLRGLGSPGALALADSGRRLRQHRDLEFMRLGLGG